MKRQAMRQRPKHRRMMSATRRFIIVGVMVVVDPSRTTSLGITAIVVKECAPQGCLKRVYCSELSHLKEHMVLGSCEHGQTTVGFQSCISPHAS